MSAVSADRMIRRAACHLHEVINFKVDFPTRDEAGVEIACMIQQLLQ